MSDSDTDTPKIALAAVFITSLVTAQLLAVKLLAVPLPGTLPVVGGTVLVPAGVIAYALTFFATDCYAELYGRRPAQVLVNIGFGMIVVTLGLVWLAIRAPGSRSGVDPTAFASVLGVSTNIMIASLVAYVVSQNWDVLAFHAIGARTEGRHLWLRNLGSTGSSQLIDTVVFISLAFSVVPSALGVGEALPGTVLLQLILGQYIIKLVIAALDTPFVYAVTGFLRSDGLVDAPENVTD